MNNDPASPVEQTKPGGNITVGDIVNSEAIAIGDGARAEVHHHYHLAASPVPQEPKSLFFVPFPHNPDFVGRDVELTALHDMLQQSNSPVGIRPTVLVGLGGIGKTQLAVEYAHAHRANYPGGIFWLNAVNPLLFEFSDLAEKLDLADRETPRDKAARKAWDYLDAHPDSLVIFDNVVEPSELNVPFSPDLIPANLRCRTLFTTRQRDFPRTFQPFEVKVLPEMAAMRLLLRSRSEVLEEHHPDWGWARIVCASLGWLPLALELAAAYLGTYPEVSVTGYLERLRTEGRLETVDDTELHPEDLPTRHDIAVTATLRTQWNRLEDQDAQLLFGAAGQFPEASWISIPRLGLLTGIENEIAPGHPSSLSIALKKLHAISLIEELTDERLRLHPLVQDFAARLSSRNFRLELADRAVALFENFPKLQARVIRYGIETVLEDARTALTFYGREPANAGYLLLTDLERVLDRQAHHLRSWEPQAQPAFFLQQLRNESFMLEFGRLQTCAEAHLAQLNSPYLSAQFRTYHESPELVRTLARHTDVVRCVALRTDGRLAVSGSQDMTLKIWDIATGRELRTLLGHTATAAAAVLTVNGQLVISASGDNTLKVWEVASGRELRTLFGHRDAVTGVALSADGQLAISASRDKTLKMWNMATGRDLCTLRGHDKAVTDVALSADGRLAVSTSADHTLKVWEVATGYELHTLRGHSAAVTCVALSADGRLAISGSDDGVLTIWDVMAGQELRTLRHGSHVFDVALRADGRLAVSASSNKTLKLWDVVTGCELRTLQGHSNSIASVALSTDGQLVISGSVDHTVKIWNIPTGSNTQLTPSSQHAEAGFGTDHVTVTPSHQSRVVQHRDRVFDIAVSADGQLAVSGSRDKTLKVWAIATGQELHTLRGHTHTVMGVALSADGQLIGSASQDGTVKVWEVSTGRELQTLYGHSAAVNAVALSADGQMIISASRDKTLKVWNVATGRELFTLQGHTDSVNGVALSSDGQFVVSASGDKTLKLWQIATGRELRTFQGHSQAVRRMALNADGRLIVSAALDMTLKVWDRTIEQALYTYRGHCKSITGVALTAGGQLATSVSSDRTLRVWNTMTGETVAMAPIDVFLLCCAMTPNGKLIVAGDALGIVHFWKLVDEGEILKLETVQH